ncbi:hypothetical protein N7528_000040 [Penicillium herquei]|nr:hypothetical protein N7528_000040 [Penicillium herquei]
MSCRSPTASTTPPCTGHMYQVKDNDTCEMISFENNISTDHLAQLNNLAYYCEELLPKQQICIQDQCEVQKIQKADTCSSILKGKSFGMVQLIAWNPMIHHTCDNLDGMIGRSICISPPGGGNFKNPSTSTTTSRTLSSSWFTDWVSASSTSLSSISNSWYWMSTESIRIPTVTTFTINESFASHLSELTQYCWLNDDDYATVDPSEDFSAPIPTSPVIPDTCTPGHSPMDTGTDSTIPTSTSSTSRGGVSTPTPHQPGMIQDCNLFYHVEKGDWCEKIANQYHISLSDFYTWNPAVTDKCLIYIGDYVCVGRLPSTSPTTSTTTTTTAHTGITTPGPIQTGMTSHCNSFYEVQKGEWCALIVDKFHIQLSQFYEWNPAVGTDCHDLETGVFVCVGVS